MLIYYFEMGLAKRNGKNLKLIEEQTNKIRLEAVKCNGKKLKLIEEQTSEICLEAVKQNGLALKYVKEQTSEICLEAVKQNGLALEFVKEQTNEICLDAIKQYIHALRYVKKQTKDVCLEAVKQLGFSLRYIRKQTRIICLEAVKQCVNSFKCVDIKYANIIYKYLKSINFTGLHNDYKFIIDKNINGFMKYYECNKYSNGWGIKYLKQNLNICKLVINSSYYYDHDFSYINYKKLKLCLQIIKTFNKGFRYINKQYIEVLL